jgi:hypothetical protein
VFGLRIRLANCLQNTLLKNQDIALPHFTTKHIYEETTRYSARALMTKYTDPKKGEITRFS